MQAIDNRKTAHVRAAPDAVLQSWGFVAEQDSCSLVLPDGCRDLIIRTLPDGGWQHDVSDLDHKAYEVGCQQDEHFRGYRFHPAAILDVAGLLSAVGSLAYPEEGLILQVVDDFVRIDTRVREVLEAISSSASIVAASRCVGVSERTVERLVTAQTGQTPSFWKSLVRMRRAARAIMPVEGLARVLPHRPLAEVAYELGYADQAHMNREFRRWLGATPAQFRDNPRLYGGLMIGYD